MKKHLLLTLFSFILLSTSAWAQDETDVDQHMDGPLDDTIECNDLDQTAFEANLETIFMAYTFTDNNNGNPCNGVLAYIPNSLDITSNWPLNNCSGSVIVEIDILCDGATTLVDVEVELDLTDITPPVFIGPDQTPPPFECDGTDADLIAWINNILGDKANLFEDNCDDDLDISVSPDPPSVDFTTCVDGLIIPVTFTVTDDCGNPASQTWDYEYADSSGPTWNNNDPSDMATCDGTEDAIDAWIDDILNNPTNYWDDDCSGNNIAVSITGGTDPRPLDFSVCGHVSYSIQFTAVDACNVTDDQIWTFDYVDTTAPTWNNNDPSDTFTCDGTEDAIDAWIDDILNNPTNYWDDDCSGNNITVSITGGTDPRPLDFSVCGNATYSIEFTAEDPCGLQDVQTWIFDYEDTTPPMMISDPTTSFECDGTDTDLVAWIADVENNPTNYFMEECGGPVTVVVQNDPTPLPFDVCMDNVNFDIEFLVSDDCGNQFVQIFTYTYTDSFGPTYNGTTPPATPFECDGTETDLDNWINDVLNNPATYWADDCSPGLTVSLTGDPRPIDFSTCQNTTYNIEFTTEDDCGRTDVQVFDYEYQDTQGPSFIGTAPNTTFECDGTETDLTDWINDILNNPSTYWQDDCSNNNITVTVAGDPRPIDFTTCQNMVYSIDFTAEDPCGLSDTQTFTYEYTDTQAPTVINDPSKTFVCDGTDADLVAWIDDIENNPTTYFEDACGNDMTVTVSGNPTPVNFAACLNGTPFTIDFDVADACGLSEIYQFTYEYVDTTEPFYTGATPAGLDVVPCDQAQNQADFDAFVAEIVTNGGSNVYFEDDCQDVTSGGLTITLDASTNPTPFDYTTCGAGQFVIEFDVTDLCGNSLSGAQFLFEITDMDAPIMVNPPDLTLDPCGANIEDEINDWITDLTNNEFGGNPIFEDNCGGVTITNIVNPIPNPFDLLGMCIGQAWVFTIDVQDCSGLTSTFSATLEVVDVDPAMALDGDEAVFDYSECWDPANPPPPEDYPVIELLDACGDVAVNIGGSFTPGNPAVTIPPENCQPGELLYTWDDGCGNTYMHTMEFNALGGNDPLEWIGGAPTGLPAMGEVIIFTEGSGGNCDGVFPTCTEWTDNEDNLNQVTYEWEVIEGTHFQGGCPPYMINYSHDPCGTIGGTVDTAPAATTVTSVVVSVTDACGFDIGWDYSVSWECGTCNLGGFVCEFCEDTDAGTPDDCKLCDPAELISGYESCTLPCPAPCDPQPGQPGGLCGTGVPHNMSWFAFVASGSAADVNLVDVVDCTGGCGGVQSGVFDMCDGACVGDEANCQTNDFSYAISGMVVGQTYYLWVDGCCGAECQYTIVIDGINELALDDMAAIQVVSDCRDEPCVANCDDCEVGAEMAIVCPGEILKFIPLHQGNRGNFEGYENECDTYAEAFDAEYTWTTTWAGDFITNPSQSGGEFLEPLQVPMHTTTTTETVCLTKIEFDCNTLNTTMCIDVIVTPIPEETYTYDVCREDLDFGWFPGDAQIDKDPNGDGFEWLGDAPVSLGEVMGWSINGDGYHCSPPFQHEDPDCQCLVPQVLCVKIQGEDGIKKDQVLYMYECQFLEYDDPGMENENFDIVEYPWIWTSSYFDFPTGDDYDDIELEMNQGFMCYNIEEFHPDIDMWLSASENCDTIVNIAVEVVKPPGLPDDSAGCGIYTWQFDHDEMDSNNQYDDYPPIDNFPNSVTIEFIDCNTGALLPNQSYIPGTPNIGTIEIGTPREVCVRASYAFENGAWYDDEEEEYIGERIDREECYSIYGPYQWGSALSVAPTIDGPNDICETSLTGHTYVVTNVNALYTYDWSSSTGVTFDGPSDGTSVTVDFIAGEAVCIKCIATTPCDFPEVELCITQTPAPTVSISGEQDVCVGDDLTLTATTSGGSGNFSYNWSNGTTTPGNTITIPYDAAGPQCISVNAEDGVCNSSESLPVCFEVIAPLVPPTVNCTDEQQTSVTWEWSHPDPNVTMFQYIIQNDDGTFQSAVTTSNLTITESGLTVGQTLNIEVIAIGPPPCGDSPSTTATCSTTTCPSSGLIVDLGTLPRIYCTNETTADIDINDYITYNSFPGESFMFSSVPAGAVDAAGIFNPTGLVPDVYVIDLVYSFPSGGDVCTSSSSVQFTVLPAPAADFAPVSPVCEGSPAALNYTGTGTISTAESDLMGGVLSNGAVTWTQPGTYTITLVVTQQGCSNESTEVIVVEEQLSSFPVICLQTGLDAVTFGWDAVPGAGSYDISYTINGATPATDVTGLTDPMHTVGSLVANDVVDIIVTAILTDSQCLNPTGMGTCEAQECPTYPLISLDPVCTEDGTFDVTWNNPAGLSTFEVTYNGVTTTQTTTGFNLTGLPALTNVEITVIGFDADGCPTAPATGGCPIPCEGAPVMGPISCGLASLSSVEFTWEAVNNASGYIVNGVDVGNVLSWPVDNLCPGEPVDISIIAINMDPLCNNSDEVTWTCSADPGELVMGDITCGASTLTSVEFTWEAVPNAVGYSVNGVDVGNILSWPVDNLCPGDAVEITVQALNADINCPDSNRKTETCVALPGDLVMGPITCGTATLNSVEFTWDPVPNAIGYTVDDVDVGNILSWPVDNLCPGESVMITVGALNEDTNCPNSNTITATCRAMQGDLEMGVISCGATSFTSVQFTWDAVDGASGYEVNGVDEGNNLSYIVNDLCPGDVVSIDVVAINATSCPNSQSVSSPPCSAAPCPIFNINCPGGNGLVDVVNFDWDDIPDVTEYGIMWRIVGNTAFEDGGTQTNSDFQVTGLPDGALIEIQVTPIIGTCTSCTAMEAECSSIECPNPQLMDIMPSPDIVVDCWTPSAGPIDLVILGDILDGPGGPVLTGGTIEWDDTNPDVVGSTFTPDPEQTDSYIVQYTWIDPVNAICTATGFINIDVYIEPDFTIDNVDDICEGEVAILLASQVADASATYVWDWGTGTSGTSMGAGPHDVTFPGNGDYTVTCTVTSGPLCNSVETTTITVDEQLDITIACTGFTNESITFTWDDPSGGNMFSYTLTDNTGATVESDNINATSITIDGLDSSIEYQMSITDASGVSTCSIEGSTSCMPTSCAAIAFDPAGTYEYGGYCSGDDAIITQLPGASLLTTTPQGGLENEEWASTDPSVNAANGVIDLTMVTFPSVIEVTYTATFDAVNNCSYDTTFMLTFFENPIISEVVPNVPDCILEEVPNFEISTIGGTEPYTYFIGNAPAIETNMAVYEPTAPGVYPVVVVDANGCRFESSVNVRPADSPVVEIDGPSQIFNSETGMFELNLSGTSAPVTAVQWYVNDILLILDPDQDIVEVIASFDEYPEGQFTIRAEVYFADDCFVEAEERIIDIFDVTRIYIPNVIDTKGTGLDSKWTVFTKGNVILNNYSIYDRWGELIYTRELDPMIDAIELTGANETAVQWNLDWEGKWGAENPADFKDTEEGVFVYVIETLTDGVTDYETGNITIFR